MAEKIFRKPKAVLIFNRRKTLALMAASVNEAAKISGSTRKLGRQKGGGGALAVISTLRCW